MSTHSVAEAMKMLDELIDRALKNEAIVITRNGRAVELKSIYAPPHEVGPITPEALDWLKGRRLRLKPKD